MFVFLRRSEERHRRRSKSPLKEGKKVDKEKKDFSRKLDDTEAEEKYKKLLILRKKMELLELKKKKEEEQVIKLIFIITLIIFLNKFSLEITGRKTAQSQRGTRDVRTSKEG